MFDFDSNSTSVADKFLKIIKTNKVFGVVGLLAVGSLGLTFSGAININGSGSGGAVTFGQGVAQTTTCDSQVTITPTSRYDAGASKFLLDHVNVSDIANSCQNKQFNLNFFKSDGTLLTDIPIGVAYNTSPSNSFDVVSPIVNAVVMNQEFHTDTNGLGEKGAGDEIGASSFLIGSITNGAGEPLLSADVARVTIEATEKNSSNMAIVDNSYKVVGEDGGPDIFLRGTYVQAGFANNGSVGAWALPPSSDRNGAISWRGGLTLQADGIGLISDRNRDATWLDGDYILPGTPYEGWYVDAGGLSTAYADNDGTDGIVGWEFGNVTKAAGSMAVTHNSSLGSGLEVSQTYAVPVGSGSFTGDHELHFNVRITNTTNSPISDIVYSRSLDPDNLSYWGDGPTTLNTVRAEYGVGGKHYSLVTAESSDDMGATFPSYLGIYSNDPRSIVSRRDDFIGFGRPDTASALFGPGYVTDPTDAGIVGDGGISIGFNIGTLAPGESTVVSFMYVTLSSNLVGTVPNGDVTHETGPRDYNFGPPARLQTSGNNATRRK